MSEHAQKSLAAECEEIRQMQKDQSAPASCSAVPGIVAMHAIVTDQCRANNGDLGVVAEVRSRVENRLYDILRALPQGKGTKFHIVITSDYPMNAHGNDQQNSTLSEPSS